MERMDVCTPRKGKDDKTYWTRIGTFWPAKDGKPGGTITFDALPLTDAEGRCSVALFEPRPKEDVQPTRQGSARPATARTRHPADPMDEVPFMHEWR